MLDGTVLVKVAAASVSVVPCAVAVFRRILKRLLFIMRSGGVDAGAGAS
jgi:hypothetical protein